MASAQSPLLRNLGRVAVVGASLLLLACTARAEGSSLAAPQEAAVPAPRRIGSAVSASTSLPSPVSSGTVGLGRPPTFAVVGGGAETERVSNLGALLERLPFRASLPTYAPPGLWLDVAGVAGGSGLPANFSMYFLTADESQGVLLAQGPGQGDYTRPASEAVPAEVDLRVRDVFIRDVPATLVTVDIEGSPFSSSLYWLHCGIGFNLRGTYALLGTTTIMSMAESTLRSCD